MKKTISLALLTALAAASATSAVAQTVPTPTYVGVNVGTSKQKFDLGIFARSEEDTAAKLYAGYRFTQNFGVEGGYVHHGEGDFPLSGTILTTKPRSIYLAGTASFPVAENFAVFGKLGATNNKVKFSNSSARGSSQNHTSLLAGVGAAYAFSPTLSGVIEYEHFGKLIDDDIATLKAQTLSIGIRASF